MKKQLKILIVEDSEDDTVLVLYQIKKGAYDIDYIRVETAESMKSALKNNQWDCIISDFQLPNFNGLEALDILKESGLDLPFIIVSGTIGEEVAVEAMKAGAHDYIMKNNLKRLLPAVERELREFRNRAEKKQLVKKQKESEEQLKILSHAVEQSPIMILITDTEGNIKYVNPKFESVTGYPLKEVIGKNPSIIKSGKTPEKKYKEIWETIRSTKVWHGELINKKRNGELFWVNISISPIVDKEGNITHFVSVQKDITEKKKIEEELIQAKERAEESDRLKTAFLQNISHEIRTPMMAISGFTELMVSAYNDKEQLEEYAEIVNSGCSNLLEIIHGILEIAKLESQQLSIHYNDCSIKNLFIELTRFYKDSKIITEKKNIKFSLAIYDELSDIIISTDTPKLKHIFMNLINNAFKFTEKGEITGGCKFDDDDQLVFFISDTGIGIPKDKYHHVFQRFIKLDQNKTRFQEGTGLGLAIVKELIDLLGGKIWIESEPFKGSTFYFTFPCQILQKDFGQMQQTI